MLGVFKRIFGWLGYLVRKVRYRKTADTATTIALDGSQWTRLRAQRMRETAGLDRSRYNQKAPERERERLISQAAMNYWFVCNKGFTNRSHPLTYNPYASEEMIKSSLGGDAAQAEQQWEKSGKKDQSGNELNEFWNHFEQAHKASREYKRPTMERTKPSAWWTIDAAMAQTESQRLIVNGPITGELPKSILSPMNGDLESIDEWIYSDLDEQIGLPEGSEFSHFSCDPATEVKPDATADLPEISPASDIDPALVINASLEQSAAAIFDTAANIITAARDADATVFDLDAADCAEPIEFTPQKDTVATIKSAELPAPPPVDLSAVPATESFAVPSEPAPQPEPQVSQIVFDASVDTAQTQRTFFVSASGENSDAVTYVGTAERQPTGKWLERLAADPTTPEDVLRALSQNTSTGVRECLAENPNTPADVLRTLAQDQDADIRYAIAENHNVSRDLLTLLSRDENPYVAARADQTMRRLQNEGVWLFDFNAKIKELAPTLGGAIQQPIAVK